MPDLNDFERALREADRQVAAPAGLVSRLEATLAERSASPRRLRLLIAAPIAAAAAIALLVTSMVFIAGRTRTAPPGAPPTARSAAGPGPVDASAIEIMPAAHVTFPDDSRHFARVFPSTRSDITIVRIYRSTVPATAPAPDQVPSPNEGNGL